MTEGARENHGVVGLFENSLDGWWVNTFDDCDADFHTVLLDGIKDWEKVLFGFSVENDHVWMELDEVVEMLGWLGSHHVDIHVPAFWPPNSSFVNRDAGFWRESAVGNINVGAFYERVIALDDFFVFGRVAGEDGRCDSCNCHSIPRLVSQSGASSVRLVIV